MAGMTRMTRMTIPPPQRTAALSTAVSSASAAAPGNELCMADVGELRGVSFNCLFRLKILVRFPAYHFAVTTGTGLDRRNGGLR